MADGDHIRVVGPEEQMSEDIADCQQLTLVLSRKTRAMQGSFNDLLARIEKLEKAAPSIPVESSMGESFWSFGPSEHFTI